MSLFQKESGLPLPPKKKTIFLPFFLSPLILYTTPASQHSFPFHTKRTSPLVSSFLSLTWGEKSRRRELELIYLSKGDWRFFFIFLFLLFHIRILEKKKLYYQLFFLSFMVLFLSFFLWSFSLSIYFYFFLKLYWKKK